MMSRKVAAAALLACLLWSCFCLRAFPSSAQAGDPWDGRYKDSPVVQMLDETQITVNSDGTCTSTYHEIHRIQKESARDEGECRLSYDESYQALKDIKVAVVTADGRRLMPSKEQEFSENQQDAVYSSEKVHVMSLPEVNVGSSIDKCYTIEDKKALFPNQFSYLFFLNSYTPTKTLRYSMSFPEAMPVRVLKFNTDFTPKKEFSGGRVIYTWELSNLQPLRSEDHAPSEYETAPLVVVTTHRDWESISNWYWSLMKKNIAVNDDIRSKVKALTAGKPGCIERAEAILGFIRKDFRYVSMSLGANRYEPHPAAEVFRNRYGDCKDQVTLTLAMLKEAGINAWPALFISEEDGHMFRDAPSITYFNHVILVIEEDGKKYYVDPLVKGYRIGEIPSDEKGAWLYVVNESGGYCDRVPADDDSLCSTEELDTYTIRGDGSALFESSAKLDREDSIEFSHALGELTDDDRKDLLKNIEKKSVGSKVLEFSHSGRENPYASLTMKLKMEIPNIATVQGKMLIITPDYLKPDIAFLTTERIYPVVFRSSSKSSSRIQYKIPDGYRIQEIPPALSINHPLLSYQTSFSTSPGGTISQESQLVYRRGRIELKDYKDFRDICASIQKYLNNLIIVQK